MPASTNVLVMLRGRATQHLLICGLTLFALCVQFVYRVPSRVLTVWLAWIGVVLLGLGLLVVINRVLAQPVGDATVLTRAERWSTFVSLATLVMALLAPPGVASQFTQVVVWLAVMTIVLAVLVLAVRLAAPILGSETRRVLRGLEQGATMLVGAFILVSVLVFVNGYRDSAPAEEVSV